MNNVCLVGRLGKDIELKYDKNGKEYAFFSLAVKRDYKDSNGDYGVDWISCKVWGNSAEFMQKYLNKGSLIAVKGRLETYTIQNPDGTFDNRYNVVAEKVQGLSSGNNGNSQQNSNIDQAFSTQQNINNQAISNQQDSVQDNPQFFERPSVPMDFASDDLPF